MYSAADEEQFNGIKRSMIKKSHGRLRP